MALATTLEVLLRQSGLKPVFECANCNGSLEAGQWTGLADLAERDRAAAARVAIVNHTMARRFWPGRSRRVLWLGFL
jgi:hypothetical protein